MDNRCRSNEQDKRQEERECRIHVGRGNEGSRSDKVTDERTEFGRKVLAYLTGENFNE